MPVGLTGEYKGRKVRARVPAEIALGVTESPHVASLGFPLNCFRISEGIDWFRPRLTRFVLTTPSLDVVSDCEMDDGRSIVGVSTPWRVARLRIAATIPTSKPFRSNSLARRAHATGQPTAVTHAADASRSVVGVRLSEAVTLVSGNSVGRKLQPPRNGRVVPRERH